MVLLATVSAAWAAELPKVESLKVTKLRMEKVALYLCDGERKKAEREFARTDFREPWPATQDATSPLFLRVTVEGHEYCVKAFTVDTDKAVSASKECNTQVASQQPRTAATRGVGVGCSQ